ncbi:MAG: hypothetical protein IJW60_05420 [Clostridia bacterium]|nr:hypothetical protein [Clostridia bacterium]
MKRIFLAVTAFCFVCAIALLVFGVRHTETHTNRRTAPTWGEKRIYRLAP